MSDKEELVDVVEALDVVRALIQLALAMVSPREIQHILDEEKVKMVNRLADISEDIKFGGKDN